MAGAGTGFAELGLSSGDRPFIDICYQLLSIISVAFEGGRDSGLGGVLLACLVAVTWH